MDKRRGKKKPNEMQNQMQLWKNCPNSLGISEIRIELRMNSYA